MTDKIDEVFNKADKIVGRTQKLLIKIVGTIVAVGLAFYLGIDQLKKEKEKVFTAPVREFRVITETDYSDEYSEAYQEDIIPTELEPIVEQLEAQEEQFDSLYIVEYLYQLDSLGDTLYIDIYNDGYKDIYYPTK